MAVTTPPRVALDPSILQGAWSRPEYRGKSIDEMSALMPQYGSWDEAIAGLGSDPLYRAMSQGQDSDRYRTMYLQSAYGLPQNYDVRGGRLVESHPARKGLALGAGMMLGLHGLDTLINGATAAAASGGGAATSAGLTTGAVAPPMTTMSSALAGGAVPGATGASMAGRSGVLGWLDKIFKGGDTANRVLDLGRTIAGAGSGAAQNRLQQAQILAALYRAQTDIAAKQADAAREAQSMGIARAQMGRQLDLTAPTVTAPSGVRMGSIQMPTLPASSREALLAQLNKPIPDYVPPTMPNIDPGKMEQILGAIGLGTTMAGQVFGGTDRAFPQTQAQQRPILDPEELTAPGLPPAPSIRFPATRG